MEIVLALCLGMSLSAACGLRVFVPPLVLSVAAIYGHLHLAEGFKWIGTQEAMITFAVATLIEVLAYYVPVLDNLLDTLSAPIVFIAGTVMTASLFGDVDPVVRWTLGVIAGGGSAGIVEGVTNIGRLTSTGITGGLANPVFATLEVIFSTLLSVLAVVAPVLGGLLVSGLLIFSVSKIIEYFAQRRYAQQQVITSEK
jgi:hypothetical protein